MCLTFPVTPDKFTAHEQVILDYISKHRDDFLCLSIGELSQQLRISEATLSRFARHVGCTDFKHLKRVVMAQGGKSGAARKLSHTLATGSGDLLQYWMEQQHYHLQKTLELLEPGEFHRAAEALAGAGRVFLFAKNASRAPAQLLEFRLRRLGLDVHRIAHGGSELLEDVATLGPGDLVVLFGFSKLSPEGQLLLSCQEEGGYKTLLFTGKTYYHLPHPPTIQLLVYRGEDHEYHAMSAPVAVVDALVLAVSRHMGEVAVSHLERIHQLKSRYGG